MGVGALTIGDGNGDEGIVGTDNRDQTGLIRQFVMDRLAHFEIFTLQVENVKTGHSRDGLADGRRRAERNIFGWIFCNP